MAIVSVNTKTANIGRPDFAPSIPTHEETEAPTPIWMKPNIAAAVPTFFEKGASANAAPLGPVSPTLKRKTKSKLIVR